MGKVLLAIVVIALGVGVGWYYFKGAKVVNPALRPSPTARQELSGATGMVPETPETTAQGSVVVRLTDSGFAPQTVTVKKGTSVTFTNAGTSNMWVASDVHPTHQLLPGFDELTSVAKGGTYTYTFTKVGTWTYHNHLQPTVKGTVVVTD